MTQPLTVQCPAKINLALAVGGPRSGDGYHPICSWMIQVSLYDQLTVEPLVRNPKSEYHIRWASDAPQPSPIDWPIEKDLIVKAHRLLERQAGRELPLRATLNKRIPVGAGMAGGSTDGAAMLQAVNRAFDLKLTPAAMIPLAAKLGSDLPFFLGRRSAIVSGVGEKLEPAPLAARLHLALITPALHCNTAAVYRTFDAVTPAAMLDEVGVRLLLKEDSLLSERLFNDLAEPAFRVEPRLRLLRDRIAADLHRPVHVTGSGAAMFILAADAAQAADLASRIRRDHAAPALPIHTL